MTHLIKLLGTVAIATFLFTSCTKDSDLTLSSDIAPFGDIAFSDQTAFSNDAVFSNSIAAQASAKSKKSLAIWADCEGFATIGTQTSFKPTAGKFDELYTGGNFKDGLGAISESKPGDKDYNGGRWHVNTLKEGVDPNKYLNACSVEELDLNDFESSPTYFECPLRPVRGKGVKTKA